MNLHSVPNATLGLPGKPITGGSKPRFYEFDDGVTRLVKWSPSPHGNKACFNELIASRLGQLIDAPILRGIIVYVADKIIPPDHRADGATAGFHFGVTRMLGENFVAPAHYNEIENSSELPAAAVHLAWLAVGDQQGHNQYLQRIEVEDHGVIKKTKRFKLIDMGQMFGNFGWTAATAASVAVQAPRTKSSGKFAEVISCLKHGADDVFVANDNITLVSRVQQGLRALESEKVQRRPRLHS
jgi:hypothetical protein